MPHITSIGTYLPRWGCDVRRITGHAEGTITMAGVTPRDVDVAEVHDSFTRIALISYEDLGFADRFEACELIDAEVTSVGGQLPVNPSGARVGLAHTARRADRGFRGRDSGSPERIVSNGD